MFRRKVKHSVESAHQFSSRPDWQRYCRSTFFHSAHCSLSNPICFRSVWCRRTMIPGKIFTGFAKLQGIVSVNDFRLPILAPRTSLGCSGSPEKFFVSHRYNWIHWVAKSCTTTAYRWLFRDSQPSLRTLWSAVIKSPKFFCTRYGSANASSARDPCNFGPLADLAISVFREVSKNTVFTQIRTSRRRRL